MEENDLTPDFIRYREAARLVWNLFLRFDDDGEFEFCDINAALFGALVESKANKYTKPAERESLRYFPHLAVRINGDPPYDVLVGIRHAGCWKFDDAKIDGGTEFLENGAVRRVLVDATKAGIIDLS